MYDPGNGWEVGPTDEDEILIQVALGREPTDQERAVVEVFASRVRDADSFVKSLNDTDKITLRSGVEVTGAELKSLWAKLDFVIRPMGTTYANGTDRGESNYNGGNPIVTININTIESYNITYEGGIFLPLHELGHLLSGTAYRDEVDSNDIARAIAARSNVGAYIYATVSYSSPSPLVFGP